MVFGIVSDSPEIPQRIHVASLLVFKNGIPSLKRFQSVMSPMRILGSC